MLSSVNSLFFFVCEWNTQNNDHDNGDGDGKDDDDDDDELDDKTITKTLQPRQ